MMIEVIGIMYFNKMKIEVTDIFCFAQVTIEIIEIFYYKGHRNVLLLSSNDWDYKKFYIKQMMIEITAQCT